MESESDLQSVFDSYSNHGHMEGSKCCKLFKDVGLVGKTLTTTDIDINFNKVKEKGQKKIVYNEFVELLGLLAPKLKMDVDKLKEKISHQKGPAYHGTKADYNKLHDDKSQYTGVYAKGGPTNVDKKIGALDQICDRSEADVRGINQNWKKGEQQWQQSLNQDNEPVHNKEHGSHQHPKQHHDVIQAEVQHPGDLQSVFDSYSNHGHMEGSKCCKLFKDVGLVGKALTTTDIDINFNKVKEKGQKKISYDQFIELLGLLAPKLKMDVDKLKEKISHQKGPAYHGTKTDYNKLHDDKSQYTGVYAKGGPTNVDKNQGLSSICDRTEADVRGVNSNWKKE